jgi:hypothetical protein
MKEDKYTPNARTRSRLERRFSAELDEYFKIAPYVPSPELIVTKEEQRRKNDHEECMRTKRRGVHKVGVQPGCTDVTLRRRVSTDNQQVRCSSRNYVQCRKKHHTCIVAMTLDSHSTVLTSSFRIAARQLGRVASYTSIDWGASLRAPATAYRGVRGAIGEGVLVPKDTSLGAPSAPVGGERGRSGDVGSCCVRVAGGRKGSDRAPTPSVTLMRTLLV